MIGKKWEPRSLKEVHLKFVAIKMINFGCRRYFGPGR